jgi:hypothetical protein
MIGLLLVFDVMEPQDDFIEKHYDLREYKLTWILLVTFLILHDYFIYIKHAYFATFMNYILDCCEFSFGKTYVD